LNVRRPGDGLLDLAPLVRVVYADSKIRANIYAMRTLLLALLLLLGRAEGFQPLLALPARVRPRCWTRYACGDRLVIKGERACSYLPGMGSTQQISPCKARKRDGITSNKIV